MQALLRFLLATVGIIACIAQTSSAQTLLERAQTLEKLADAGKYQQGVNLSKNIDHTSFTVTSETDRFVQEYYLQVRAVLQQQLAAKMSKANKEKEFLIALDCWAAYFDWLSSLSDGERKEMLSKRENKVFAAAAAYGNIVVVLDQPAKALQQYEMLRAEFFGPQAMNLWLWALLHPAYQPPIRNHIFACDDAVLNIHIKKPERTRHWVTFGKRLKEIINLPHLACHEMLSTKLDAAFASSGSSAHP